MIFHAQKCYALGVIFFSKDVNDALFFAYRYTFQFSHFKIGYGDPLGSQAQYHSVFNRLILLRGDFCQY